MRNIARPFGRSQGGVKIAICRIASADCLDGRCTELVISLTGTSQRLAALLKISRCAGRPTLASRQPFALRVSDSSRRPLVPRRLAQRPGGLEVGRGALAAGEE